MSETLFVIAVCVALGKLLETFTDTSEYCPHCGYYCHGRSAFCTKHPDAKRNRHD